MKINRDGTVEGPSLPPFGYAKGRSLIGRAALRTTRWLRAVHAGRYMIPCETHLDIGCGDGYFLRRSPAETRYGLDKLLGDEVTDRIDFPDASLDLVSMLAVIEHVHDPRALFEDVHRILKPGGRLVLTTPKEAAEALIHLYVSNIHDEHEVYFDPDSMREMTSDLFDLTGYHTFIFGLNQAFCLEKPKAS